MTKVRKKERKKDNIHSTNKTDIFFETFIELFVVYFRLATTVFLYVPVYTHETFCVIGYVS
jgi:hypothetical protein